MRLFHVCTIANKLDMYANMKASFIEAGFTENKCRYSLFDNSQGNIYEPYSTFKIIQSNTSEPYIVFCHQDILINQGHGFEQLIKVIKELDKKDPRWAVLGNAGVNNDYEFVVKIADPNNFKPWTGEFPQRVHSLDENFLVIKSSANFTSSDKLSGFHLYGADLCLNAIINEYSCYVIDFYITHLSGGNRDRNFWSLKAKFQEKWNKHFDFCYATGNCSIMFLSRHHWLHFIFTKQQVKKILLSSRLGKRLMSRQLVNR
jgi:hypothetical protein